MQGKLQVDQSMSRVFSSKLQLSDVWLAVASSVAHNEHAHAEFRCQNVCQTGERQGSEVSRNCARRPTACRVPSKLIRVVLISNSHDPRR